MVIWVGGLIFFAFVVAPVAFNLAYTHALPSTHEAGLVVAGTLAVLHPMGEICGAVFLFATALFWLRSPGHRLLGTEVLLTVFMLVATLYVHLHILPAMERDRIAAGGAIDAAPPDNPDRIDCTPSPRRSKAPHSSWAWASSFSWDSKTAHARRTRTEANQTLNLKKRMSPSLTTYSLPSDFSRPFSFTACSLPYLNRSSQW
jgi:hypothetical protein